MRPCSADVSSDTMCLLAGQSEIHTFKMLSELLQIKCEAELGGHSGHGMAAKTQFA